MRIKFPRRGSALLAVPAAIAALGLLGCGEEELAVGDCTTADITQIISVDVEKVDCGDSEAKSKVVKEADKGKCGPNFGSIENPDDDKKEFCLGPK
jgi:hypothetical protein